MKKLFMFLAVAGLATFGASCSSDDGGGSGGGQPALVAKASPSSVKINENVTFSATADGKAVDGVKFYSAGKELQNPHKFAAKGEYNVIAKKTGYLESAAITVTVTEEGVPTDPKTLTLTVLPAEVSLGEAVSFVVYEGTTDVSSTAKIFVNGTISGTSYTATAVGTYTVKATKEGANDSAEKTFKVVDAPTVPETNFILVNSNYGTINDATMFVNAQKINNQWVIYEYQDAPGENPYALFTMDLGTINDAGTSYEFRSRSLIVVDQTDEERYLYPGQVEGTTFFGNATAIDFLNGSESISLPFEGLERLNYTYPTTEDGDVLFDYLISGNGAEVNYNGPIEFLYVIEVDAEGTPVPTTGARGSLGNKQVVSKTLVKVSDLKRK